MALVLLSVCVLAISGTAPFWRWTLRLHTAGLRCFGHILAWPIRLVAQSAAFEFNFGKPLSPYLSNIYKSKLVEAISRQSDLYCGKLIYLEY